MLRSLYWKAWLPWILVLNIEFGKNILEVSKKVQDKVKSSIENMTGPEVADVNIRIAGVDMENDEKKRKESKPFLFSVLGKYAKKRTERTYF